METNSTDAQDELIPVEKDDKVEEVEPEEQKQLEKVGMRLGVGRVALGGDVLAQQKVQAKVRGRWHSAAAAAPKSVDGLEEDIAMAELAERKAAEQEEKVTKGEERMRLLLFGQPAIEGFV